jgi:ABC-type transport system substrate-binding protein
MTDLLPTFRTNPWISVFEADVPGLVYQYLAFNTNLINVTWRKAMSYAINYTYILEELLDGRAFRSYGCVSPGYGNAFNHWLRDAPGPADNGSAVYDLTVARQTLIDDPGIDTTGLTANSNPDDTAWHGAGLATFNYSYNADNWFRSDLYTVLDDWFEDIGITLEDGASDWGYFILRAYGYVPGGYDQLEVYFIGWGPDYLDPFNMIDPLYSNISVSNACQINDPWVMGNLSLALQTTDQAARYQIYWDIQWRLFAELYAHAPVYHSFITSVHAANLYDVEYDVMGRWWALPVKRNATWEPEL